MKRQLLTTILTVALAGSTFAATTGTINLRGTVANANAIVVTNDNTATITAGDSSSSDTFATMQLVNNDPNGFTLTLASTTNDGHLLHASAANLAGAGEHEKVAYTINLTVNTGATPNDPASNLLTGIDLSADADNSIDISFAPSTGTTAPTDITYNVVVASKDKNGLAHGNYADAITATIADI